MKKILLLVFSVLIAAGSQAQQATFVPSSGNNDTVTAMFTSGSTFDVHNDIASTNGNPVRLRWKVAYANFGTGWDGTNSGLCDNTGCYANLSTRYANNTISDVTDPYTTLSTFKMQFFATNVPNGSRAVVTIRVYDTAAPNYTRNLTFVAYKSATSIGQTAANDNSVTVYPNPARESVNVRFDGQMDVKTIAIYNMIGKTMRVFKPSDNNSAKLDLDAIPSGVYFVRLMNSDGRIVATRRFTRQ